jgi:hypothetical protein
MNMPKLSIKYDYLYLYEESPFSITSPFPNFVGTMMILEHVILFLAFCHFIFNYIVGHLKKLCDKII